MPDSARYSYNPRSRRYHDRASGRFVSAKRVRFAVDTIIDKESAKLRNVAQQLVDGSINLAEWQIQTAALVKNLHVAMGLAANGGLHNTSAADLGFIGTQLKEQYQYLRDFALQIKKGEQALDGTLVARAALYGQAARGTYERVVARAARNGGATQEKSVLGAADHCSKCVGEAKKGWQPIGTLIPIGERTCLANCHCTFQYQ
jgi:hypothetical protein